MLCGLRDLGLTNPSAWPSVLRLTDLFGCRGFFFFFSSPVSVVMIDGFDDDGITMSNPPDRNGGLLCL